MQVQQAASTETVKIPHTKSLTKMYASANKSTTSSSNWILMSCQPHRVTSGQSNSGHKQIHISKLFSQIYLNRYQPSVKSIYKTNHFTNLKHAQTSDTNFQS